MTKRHVITETFEGIVVKEDAIDDPAYWIISVDFPDARDVLFNKRDYEGLYNASPGDKIIQTVEIVAYVKPVSSEDQWDNEIHTECHIHFVTIKQTPPEILSKYDTLEL